MMTGAEHYAKGDELLAALHTAMDAGEATADGIELTTRIIQAHAALAHAWRGEFTDTQ